MPQPRRNCCVGSNRNRNRAYADQVKPFGFLTALSASNLEAGETFAAPKRAGRPKMGKPVKPISPFTRDPAEAAHCAFDRESGQLIAFGQLKTCKQMLAQYHLQPESKFLNGQFLDHGTTRRRHIHSMAFIQIGKEANELDRQMYLGSEGDLNPDYGLSLSDISRLEEHLHYVIKVLGRRKVADALGVNPQVLATVVRKREPGFV